MRGEFLTWIYCCQKYKNWHWDPCNEVLHCYWRNFVHTEYMLNLFNRSLMVWSEEIMRAFESVVGERLVGASKQAKPKQKLVVERGFREEGWQSRIFWRRNPSTRPIGSLLPTSRSLVCFSSRARGFSRATSFSAPMIKIGNIAVVVACPRADDGLLRT